MKRIFLFIMAMAMLLTHAQNVGIGTKNPQNKLHIAGGLRIDSLAAKSNRGLVLHNPAGDVYSVPLTGKKTDVLTGDGTFANVAAATGDAWLLHGNAGTDTSNFLGTTDAHPLKFRINNEPFGSLGSNIAFGEHALVAPNLGSENVAIGTWSLQHLRNSYFNTSVGSGSLFSFIGPTESNSDVGENVAYGANSLYSNLRGDNHTAIGYQALYSEKGGSNLTAVGHNALYANNGGIMNTAIGFQTLRYNTTGGQNTAVGYTSLYSNVTGGQNTAVGLESLYHNLTGSGNSAYGFRTLAFNTGSNNTGTGMEALFRNTSGSSNVATGFRALYSNTNGIEHTATGYNALYYNTTGKSNTATGASALLKNTSGNYNAAVGSQSLLSNTAGSNNAASGYKALYSNVTGSNNTASGYQALNLNTTGSNNTAVGMSADVTSGNLTNATAIGYNAKVNASNKVRIGNAAVTKIEGQVPFTTPSDGRFKFNVKEDVKGLAFILQLRPVTYQFDVKQFDHVTFAADKNEAYEKAALIRRTGFIAQEVEQAAIAAGYNFSGIDKPASAEDHYSLSYEAFVVPLVKAMQEQQTIIERQQQQIEQLLRRMELLEQKSGSFKPQN